MRLKKIEQKSRKLTHLASSSIQTWLVGAIAELLITVSTGVSWWTATCVRSWAGVEARAAIATGFVIGAVVEILIAK